MNGTGVVVECIVSYSGFRLGTYESNTPLDSCNHKIRGRYGNHWPQGLSSLTAKTRFFSWGDMYSNTICSIIIHYIYVYGCFLKWWYPQNTPKWSFLVGKPMVVGYPHLRKPPYVVVKHRHVKLHQCYQVFNPGELDIDLDDVTSRQPQIGSMTCTYIQKYIH